jgi:Ala-tRNA(Pro) deacylase
LEDHKKFGGNPDIDIPCQYLKYFEMDDDKLTQIHSQFKNGELTCGDTKKILADTLVPYILEHQQKRSEVTNEVLQNFYAKKRMELPKPKSKEQLPEEKQLYDTLNSLGISHETLYHEAITTMQEGENVAKRLTGTICKNLFLKEKGTFYLYVTNNDTVVDMKALPKKLGIKNIRFAEQNCLQQILNVPKGCSSVLALVNDKSKQITVVIDETVNPELNVNFHPLRNDATTTIHYKDMMTFLTSLGYTPISISS